MKPRKNGVVVMVLKRPMMIPSHGLLKYPVVLVCDDIFLLFIHIYFHLFIDLDPNEDQFAKRTAAKKERVAKNEFQRLKNIARANKINGK